MMVVLEGVEIGVHHGGHVRGDRVVVLLYGTR